MKLSMRDRARPGFLATLRLSRSSESPMPYDADQHVGFAVTAGRRTFSSSAPSGLLESPGLPARLAERHAGQQTAGQHVLASAPEAVAFCGGSQGSIKGSQRSHGPGAGAADKATMGGRICSSLTNAEKSSAEAISAAWDPTMKTVSLRAR